MWGEYPLDPPYIAVNNGTMKLWPFSRKKPQNQQITHPAHLWAEIFGGAETISGIEVTPEKAMTVPAINRGVHLLSDMVGMMPLSLYQRLPDNGKEKAKNHRQYNFIRNRPNEYQSAYQFRYLMQRHMLLRGNAYAFKIRVRGYLQRLMPIHPKRVEVEQDDSFAVNYKVTMPSGLKRDYGPQDIWHLRPHTEDGIIGLGIVSEAPESIAMCIAAEKHGAMLFGNGAKPGGILSTDQKLAQEQVNRIRESWQKAFGGDNKYSTAVLDGGMKWNQTGMDNEKAQYLEVRSFQVAEAARLLGVPPILLFHSDTSSTFASAKELVQAFLKFSLDPWLTYWETEYNQGVLNQEQNGKYFVEFIRQGIERMDLQSRVDAYQKMIQSRIMNPNEARERENMNPYSGGDEFLNPAITPGGQDDAGTGTE